MARNEEKALTFWNKWQTFKKDFHSISANKRPLLASDCDSLPDAEKWRRELVRDISKKVAAIKNPSLGEQRLRELNDDINKMIRQKHYIEIRIRELGGNVPISKQYYEVEGKELPGAPNYKYFGAAKDLPGVKELFAEEEDNLESIDKRKKARIDVVIQTTPEYFGLNDVNNQDLETLENEKEEQLLGEVVDENQTNNYNSDEDEFEKLQSLTTFAATTYSQANQPDNYEPVIYTRPGPHSTEEVEEEDSDSEELLAKKKKALLEMFS